jgi:hypothetical protein
MVNSNRQRGSRRLSWVVLSSLLMLSQLTALSGCTRRFFRRRSDAEVDLVLAQKDKYPGWWKLQNFWVYPHPLSRFADPSDPDRPPMPPDDPAAWDLSPHPQRPLARGYRYWEGTGYLDLMRKWDEENRTKIDTELAAQKEKEGEEEEGEEPKLPGEVKTFAERGREIDLQIERELNSPIRGNKQLPITLDVEQAPTVKPFLLNLEQMTELGFLNSREFQTIREQLYLTALTVTAERFAFVAQPFVTEQMVRESSGAKSVDGRTNRWLASTTTGFTKAFSTGALLLMNFANQTVYNLGGGPLGTTSVSTINLDLIQPFLAGGGRAVALEPLTQAERDLVYAIRQFYRFRQEYFVFFAAGQSTGFIPGVGAGVLAILPGTVAQPNAFVPGPFTLPIVNNPATVQVAPQPNLGAILNSGVLITPQGYLSAIQERTVLFNYYKNIQALQRFLRLYDVWLEGGLVTQVQRGLVEARLLLNYETVLGQQVNFRVSLDQLKQQLGLPLTVPLDLAPGPLQPMINIIEAYEKLAINVQRVTYNGLQYGRSPEKAEQVKQLRGRLRRMLDRSLLLRGTKTRERIFNRLPYWENFGKDLNANQRLIALDDRSAELAKQYNAIRDKERETPGTPLSEAEQRRKDESLFEYDLARYEWRLSNYERMPWQLDGNALPEAAQKRQARELFSGVMQIFFTLAQYAMVERQMDIKDQWPALAPIRAEGVDLLAAPEEEALAAVERATMTNRVDLMNVRAQLTDSWRKIRVAANALLGTFNVDYHVDASSPAGGSNPFALGGSRTRHELIFTGQLPLVRILQRNNYRSTLINFQQNRRSLMAFEDQLLFNVRFDLRQVRILANNYQRVQKRQIELAYMQVDQALQAFNQPQAPPAPGSEIQGLVGPVAARPQVGDPAALTTQLLSTQGSLLSSQNDLYNTWIVYTIDRMDLYRDMGVMPLDNRGVWIDADATSNNTADNCQSAGGQQPAGAPDQLPPPRPEQPPQRLPQPRAEPAAQGPPLEPAR